jgi:hypothetical protein
MLSGIGSVAPGSRPFRAKTDSISEQSRRTGGPAIPQSRLDRLSVRKAGICVSCSVDGLGEQMVFARLISRKSIVQCSGPMHATLDR